MKRARFRTRSSPAHIAAVKSRKLLDFGTACIIAGLTRREMARLMSPDGAPFTKHGMRWFITATDLKALISRR
jgi:hypothetical protein